MFSYDVRFSGQMQPVADGHEERVAELRDGIGTMLAQLHARGFGVDHCTVNGQEIRLQVDAEELKGDPDAWLAEMDRKLKEGAVRVETRTGTIDLGEDERTP